MTSRRVAAAELSTIDSASMAIVTLAYPAVSSAAGQRSAGRRHDEGLRVKAVTLVVAEMAGHAAGPDDAARVASDGSARTPMCSATTTTSWRLVRDELRTLIGVDAVPDRLAGDALGRGLPQYAVGHVEKVARIRAAMARCRGSASAEPPTTAWESRRASPRRDSPPTRYSRASQSEDNERHGRRQAGTRTQRRSSATPRGRCSGRATPLGDDDRPALGAEVIRAVRPAGRQGRHRPRHLRRQRAAGGRRSDDLVACAVRRRAAGGLQPIPPNPARAPPPTGVVVDGAASAGGVQQEPRPGFPRRRAAACVCLRVPVRAVLRVVPAARRRAARAARRARPDGPRVPRRAREHRRVVRARATTSGCSPSRPTNCIASSI